MGIRPGGPLLRLEEREEHDLSRDGRIVADYEREQGKREVLGNLRNATMDQPERRGQRDINKAADALKALAPAVSNLSKEAMEELGREVTVIPSGATEKRIASSGAINGFFGFVLSGRAEIRNANGKVLELITQSEPFASFWLVHDEEWASLYVCKGIAAGASPSSCPTAAAEMDNFTGKSRRECLSQCTELGSCPQPSLAPLEKHLKPFVFASGSVFSLDTETRAYIVESGKAAIVTEDTVMVGSVQEGRCFGTPSAFPEFRRGLYAVATQPLTGFSITVYELQRQAPSRVLECFRSTLSVVWDCVDVRLRSRYPSSHLLGEEEPLDELPSRSAPSDIAAIYSHLRQSRPSAPQISLDSLCHASHSSEDATTRTKLSRASSLPSLLSHNEKR